MPTIKLQSSEGQIHEVDSEVIKCSGTLRHMMNILGVDNTVIPVPKVNAETLDYILQWAKWHHKFDPIIREMEQKSRTKYGPNTMLKFDYQLLSINQGKHMSKKTF